VRDYALCGCRGECDIYAAIARALNDRDEKAARSAWLDHVLDRQRYLEKVGTATKEAA
jgi:DNA-binding FadR family transcriptional regulator